jgi:hypothetical protein
MKGGGEMRIDLSEEEAKILRETLSGEISELGLEIADTDQKDFREMLKGRKQILKSVMSKLERVAA